MNRSPDHWDLESLRARISDVKTRRRYAGGSPDEQEIAAYAAGLPAGMEDRAAIVLGMTPELRLLLARRFAQVYAVDASRRAIEVYRDWLDGEHRARETIVHGSWFDLAQYVPGGAAVVAGDGVFGNLPDVSAHRKLMDVIASVLLPGGRFVTRMAMIPDGFVPGEHEVAVLLQRYRRGEIDEAEFGFGVRLVGHHEYCYDPVTFTLDNTKLYAACERMWRAGELTDAEHAVIRRYYFGGTNCIVTQRVWEDVLRGAGFEFRTRPCHGKQWYGYYVVYEARPRRVFRAERRRAAAGIRRKKN